MELIDLYPLLERAFFSANARDATPALVEARARFAEGPNAKSFSYEVVIPPVPDRGWFERGLIARLVYHCESTRSRLPYCRGVFVSFFIGESLYCVAASEVIAFGARLLGKSSEELVQAYGTGEARAPLREPVALLGASRSEGGD